MDDGLRFGYDISLHGIAFHKCLLRKLHIPRKSNCLIDGLLYQFFVNHISQCIVVVCPVAPRRLGCFGPAIYLLLGFGLRSRAN